MNVFLAFLQAVQSVLTIVIIMLAGYFMTRAGWFDEKIGSAFTKVILYVALPCYMFWNLRTSLSRSEFLSFCGGMVVPVISMAAAYGVSILICRAARVEIKHRGVFRSIFFCSNTIFIGLPVNLALFGERSVPYVLLYYIVNTSFFWTLGVREIRRDGHIVPRPETENRKKRLMRTMTRILPPALLGFILGVVFILLKLWPPDFVMNTCKYLGELTTPLALLFIGIILSAVDFRKLRVSRDILLLLFGRFVFCPLTVLLLIRIIPVSPMMGKVFVIQACLPAMTSTGVLAQEYGADVEFATTATVLTTVLSMLVIPVYFILVMH